MDEKLVYIGKILSLEPIPNADFIVAATVVAGLGGKWRGVVKKDAFEVGNLCIVYLPDSLIPESEEMKFMQSTQWRVRMRRFKGVPSEVVIMPLPLWLGTLPIGSDITLQMLVKKYHKPIPANLQGKVKGDFPSFIRKTDEPNFQSSQDLIDKLAGKTYYITEKADGASTTAYKYKGIFGVCSRNWELEEEAENGYWEIANRYNLREKLPEGYAIQWETCGPKIQSNPMGLNKVEGFAFSIWDIVNQRYLNLDEFGKMVMEMGFPTVRFLCGGLWLDREMIRAINFPSIRMLSYEQSFEPLDLTKLSKGKYKNGVEREGIVIRSSDYIDGKIISFKAINLDYKD